MLDPSRFAGTFEKYASTEMSQHMYACCSLMFLQLEQLLDYMHSSPEGVAGLARQTIDMYCELAPTNLFLRLSESLGTKLSCFSPGLLDEQVTS